VADVTGDGHLDLVSIVERLGLTDLGAAPPDGRRVTGAYTSDLLSDVMGFARSGEIWLTVQSHLNLVAVAALKELSAVVVCGGRTVDDTVIAKAREEGVVMLASADSSYETGGRLWELGVRRAD
jgi:hypothetical protein